MTTPTIDNSNALFTPIKNAYQHTSHSIHSKRILITLRNLITLFSGVDASKNIKTIDVFPLHNSEMQFVYVQQHYSIKIAS